MYNRSHYLAHRSEILEYQKRNYLAHRSERLEYSKRYRESHREAETARFKLWRKSHREAELARGKRWRNSNRKVYRAIKLAQFCIPLGSCCEFCGSVDKLMRFHPDYDFPLIVVTVCRHCRGSIIVEVVEGA